MFDCSLKRFCRDCVELACDRWCECIFCVYWKNNKCVGKPNKGIDGARWKSCKQGRRWKKMFEDVQETMEIGND